MRIFWKEITDQDLELDFDESKDWVLSAVQASDEQLPGIRKMGSRKVELHLNLRKVDEVVVLNGELKTQIRLMCSRCANPFSYSLSPHFSALFCKDPVLAGVGYLENERDGQPGGQKGGYARHAHAESHDSNLTSESDLDITYLTNDYIDLGEVLAEQIQLQLPFQPLCREDCKGVCSNCGADLNTGRCACAKVVKSSPFSILKDIKL